jgi:hypothetical protein
VLCSGYVLRTDGYTPFSRMRRFSVADLYPHPWAPIVWEDWVER